MDLHRYFTCRGYVCVFVRVHVHMCVCIITFEYLLVVNMLFGDMCGCVCVCVHVCVFMHGYIYTSMYVSMNIYVDKCVNRVYYLGHTCNVYYMS